MPTAAFVTLGCKVNQYETQKILESFELKGFRIVSFDSPADVYVINSCSVTHTAESKSRYSARKAARSNPDSIVVITGCASQMAHNKGETLEFAHVMVPNQDKLDTISYLLKSYPELEQKLIEEPAPLNSPKLSRRTRATVKVQDGCNIYCSYCSIPYTRPVRSSRAWDEVVDEVKHLAAEGFKEVVLTGVLIGNYGEETGSGGPDLPELIEEVAKVDGIERIRLSSIETTDVSDKLLDTMKRTPKICPHLHIPLQSGDDRILEAMNRPYSRDYFIKKCKEVITAIPDMAITTDILVGFPGEDEVAFNNTCEVVEEVGFLRGHIFRFSPRPGTPAAVMVNCTSEADKEERSKRLIELCQQTGNAYITNYLGRDMRVLVERKSSKSGLLSGHTDNYIEVHFAGSSSLCGELANVRLMQKTNEIQLGELAAKPLKESRYERLCVL